MKLPKNYFPEQATKEYGSFYVWMRFICIIAFANTVLVLGFGKLNIFTLVVIIFCIPFGFIGVYFAIFHYIRYLRNYMRQK
ncbi:hypothetical protein COE15_26660 [Bacillus cereus]|uniref:Uncharacterized protein n=1 Tax=Bacillus arachidis TaxID=2819290 RepID=A0ABS3P3L9_9BACI|nr:MULTISPECIES: hypothetical protein [Bacillus]MBO1627792.1 hypothetical protein [Bacillus arachidis]PFD97224.1 hypothetical protein CN288_22680 [Bacillus sp. AFS023182]PGX90318.1 hypothetical protein COE15_26660 [Bacillus cereus]WIY61626.1 hypothetical protein QRY57_03370 [Bacillus arachidis]